MTMAMPARTLGQLIDAHSINVLEHLDRSLEVPVLGGIQMQGDLAVIPADDRTEFSGTTRQVPAEGIAVIEAVGSGHEHRLFAGAPGTTHIHMLTRAGQDIGYLEVTAEPAYLLHPEHGATGIAPGSYVLKRQREQADEERLVTD